MDEGSFDDIGVSVNRVSTHHNLACWIFLRAALRSELIIGIIAAFGGKKSYYNNAALSEKCVSIEQQHHMALKVGTSNGCSAMITNCRDIANLSTQISLRQHHCYVLKMSFNKE